MSRGRAVLAACSTVLVCMASASMVASAEASWFVAGTALSGSAALSTTAVVEWPIELSIPAAGVSIACHGESIGSSKPEITSPNGLKAAGITLEGCETVEPKTHCALEGQPRQIKLNAVAGTAALGTKTNDRLTIAPQTGTLLATLPFEEGATCALAGEIPLKGSVNVEALGGQLEETEQAISGLGSVENNSLEVGGGNKAYLEGCPVLKLASGSKWSYR